VINGDLNIPVFRYFDGLAWNTGGESARAIRTSGESRLLWLWKRNTSIRRPAAAEVVYTNA